MVHASRCDCGFVRCGTSQRKNTVPTLLVFNELLNRAPTRRLGSGCTNSEGSMVRPGRERLSGRIQVDETYIGGRKTGKRGRGAEGKALVVIGVEDKSPKGIGRIRLKHVPDASAESLGGFVQEMIEKGSIVRTDDWLGYVRLPTLGYQREVLPSLELKLPHLVASLLKRWLLGTYQGAVRPSHLAYYLDEFTFRFNRRTSGRRGKLFYRLVQQALMVDPVSEKELKAEMPSEENFDDLEL